MRLIQFSLLLFICFYAKASVSLPSFVSTGMVLQRGKLINLWGWANAEIKNNSVIVWSDEVTMPVAVRYAWKGSPEGCNLYNKEGLPASPFRTDNW